MANIFRVFLASPGDVSEERSMFPSIVDEVNNLRKINLRFEAVGWEDALPGRGRPQEIINKDVNQCDVFVMLLWKRWGSPPQKGKGKFTSGTEEEFTIADRRARSGSKGPYILLYFRSIPQDMIADPGPQLQRVLKFRERIEKGKKFLYQRYENPTEWAKLLRQHLSQWLDLQLVLPGFAPELEVPKVKMPRHSEQRMERLQKHYSEKNRQLRDAQSKLKGEAVGYAVEAMKLIDKGNLTQAEVKFAKSIELYEEPEVMNNFGRFLFQIGSFSRAEALFERVLELTRNDRVQHAVANLNLGNVYETTGDLAKAKQSYEKALKLYRQLGRKEGIADAYRNLGDIYRTKGDLTTAERVYKQSLKINTGLRRKQGQADVYRALGIMYHIKNNLDKSMEMHEKSLKVSKSLGLKGGNAESIAKAYGNLGNVWLAKGSLSKAQDMFEKALTISQARGSRETTAKLYGNLGVIYVRRDELEKAEDMYEKSLKMSQEMGAVESMANAYNNLGLIQKKRRKLVRAQQMIEKSIEIHQKLGNKDRIAGGYQNIAAVLEDKGEIAKAKEILLKAKKLYDELGNTKYSQQIAKAIPTLGKSPRKRGSKSSK
jgi:tetratricopeptide (TPR) repeat protein